MIDAINSLAFSVSANKGVYAILLGSGVSRAAKIPTGWDITLELVRKVAALEGADCGVDPAAWFQAAKGAAPDYSMLLDTLAKTATERQQLLRPYWEPTEQEREEGAKRPTKAHRAIAELVKLGYVRVIITTNFDRLLETALQDVGIQPTVLSTTDQIEGALPLIHTACTIVKIHGDYLDTRIRNTPEELAQYPEQFSQLLDRIFDEFGLIVAGWSADWDEALRAALTRAPYRRFSTYWAARGEPGEKARDLVARKSATLVAIEDADSFFSKLEEKVAALAEFARPHPLSSEAAVVTLKKYLSEPRFRIALNDLIWSEVDRLREATSGPAFETSTTDVSGAAVEHRLHAYEAYSETIVKMAFVAGQWADSTQITSWTTALKTLAVRRYDAGTVVWIELQRYPAAMLFYAFGLGAVLANRSASLGALFDVALRRGHQEDKRAVEMLPVWELFEYGADAMKVLPNREREYTPLNNRLAEYLFKQCGKSFASEADFQIAFDKFEVLASLSYSKSSLDAGTDYWVIPGAFGWRHANRKRIISELRNMLSQTGDGSSLVVDGIVGRTAKQALENLDGLEKAVASFRWR